MITVTQQAQHHYVISDAAGVAIGWTGTRTIGFGPFADDRAAIAAAAAAWPVLQSGLARHFPGWERSDANTHAKALRVVHDGAYEWISDGRVPLARLLRKDDGRDLSIEFVLPSFASDGLAIVLAPVLARAIEPFLAVSAFAAVESRTAAPPGPPAA